MKTSKSLSIALTGVLALGIAACATIIDGSQQEVKFVVEGTDKARCVVYNEDYKYLIYAPAEVTMERSRKNLRAECTGNGGREVNFIIPSYQGGSGAVALNASNGIVPGTTVDVLTGAYFGFPDPVIIDFDVHEGYRASEVEEYDVKSKGWDVNKIWPDNMADGEFRRVPVRDGTADEGQEFVILEDNAVESDFDPNLNYEAVSELNDKLDQELSAIELLHKEYNKDVYHNHKPDSVTYREETMTSESDADGFKYEEIINKTKMQPIIEQEDASDAAYIPPLAASKTPKDMGEDVSKNMGAYVAQDDVSNESLSEASSRQKVMITEEQAIIKNMQMSPIVEAPKLEAPKVKVEKVATKPNLKTVKPTIVDPKVSMVDENAQAMDSDTTWHDDVSYFEMENIYVLLNDYYNPAPIPQITKIKSSAIIDNSADYIVGEGMKSDTVTVPVEDIIMPVDTEMQDIETSTNSLIMDGAATSDGKTQDMDEFMNELMRELEASMPPQQLKAE